MLDGFDRDWNIAGNKNSATYTNLGHGEYTFKVKSQNRSGEWSPQILTLNLTIVPPFWLTWWFKILTFISIAGSLIGFYKYRVRSIKPSRRHETMPSTTLLAPNRRRARPGTTDDVDTWQDAENLGVTKRKQHHDS